MISVTNDDNNVDTY